LASFDTAMFLSNLSAVPTGRPMAIADFDGTAMWFVTADQSPKAMEIAHDGSSLITLQGRTAYAMVRGEAELVYDPAKLRELWSSSMELWWPDGPQDKGMVLLRFVPASGQYWDMSGTHGLRFVKNMAEAKWTGMPVKPVPGAQGHALL
jgi:general stress protein 26